MVKLPWSPSWVVLWLQGMADGCGWAWLEPCSSVCQVFSSPQLDSTLNTPKATSRIGALGFVGLIVTVGVSA